MERLWAPWRLQYVTKGKSGGCIMVAPYAHIADLEELPPEAIHEMMDLAQLATRALKSSLTPDGLNVGFNLGAAAEPSWSS